jgi:MFS family permease
LGTPDAEALRPGREAGTMVTDPQSLLRSNNALQILSNAAWYAAAPFIPLYLVSQGASIDVVGVIIGCSGILPLLVSLHAGALADQRGPVLVAQASVLLFGLAGVVLATLHPVWAVAVAYTLMSVANIGFAIAPQAIVAAASTPATRVRNYGYYSLWNSAGAVVGPVLGGCVAGHFGYRAAFALVWILMVPSFWANVSMRFVPPASRHVAFATAHRLVGAIARQRGVAGVLFISFMMVWAQQLQQAFYPIYLHRVGLSTILIGFVVAAISLSSMLVRSVLTRAVEWLGYRWLLLGATALVAVALGMTPLFHRFWPLVLLSGLMGASLGITQPLSMSLMAESVAAEFWGVAFGIRQGVQRVASITSPMVLGFVITAAGLPWAFFLGGGTILATIPIMAGVTQHLRHRRDR